MKKINKFPHVIIMFLFILLLCNCKKDEYNTQNAIQNIIGYAQKGPFISGSSVTVYDLQSDLTPTGKTFNALITDNNGSFQLNNILLSSNYISLRADGFYFNELSGQPSIAQITLNALSDITGKTGININLITHLEKSRIEYLMQKGNSFIESKTQAQREILAIFSIQKSDMIFSENLNIAESGDDNAILLAISSVLQGNRTESELTELLTKISEDIKSDGVLNSDLLGSALINQARLIDTASIRNNLIERYSETGSSSNIPDFGKFIKLFLDSTKYTFTNFIEYPEDGNSGPNILSMDRINYPSRDPLSETYSLCSIAAKLPRGTFVKVFFIPDYVYDDPDPKDPAPGYYSDWGMYSGGNSGWAHSDSLFYKNHTGIFYTVESDAIIDTKFFLSLHGGATIEIYENNQSEPVRTKHIYW